MKPLATYPHPGLTAAPSLVALAASRLLFFAAAQALIAVGLAIAGDAAPWSSATGWWPVAAGLGNVASLALLVRAARAEGVPLRSFFGERGRARRDVPLLVGVIVLMAPIAQLPNVLLADALLGGAEEAFRMMSPPIPREAALFGLLVFPITIAFAELPTYYGYVLPRLEAAWGSRARALAVTAGIHALQHATLPLIFDGAFLVWRTFMFLPFAFFVGFVIQRRRSLLPYLMAIHVLLDLTVAWMVFAAST